MAVERVVVEVDLGVEGEQVAVLREQERVDLEQRRVDALERAVERLHERRPPWRTGAAGRPRPKASLRAWKGWKPDRRVDRPPSGSPSGSWPRPPRCPCRPAAEAMNTGRAGGAVDHDGEVHLAARPRGPCPARSAGAAPRGPRGRSGGCAGSCRACALAIVSHSSAVRASFTPPPLPRPPAWICAFTTTGKPSSLRGLAPPPSAVYADLALRHGHAERRQDRLPLVLVDLHGAAAGYFLTMASSSTSNTSVAPPGICGPGPLSP